jgi:hypothetical protein
MGIWRTIALVIAVVMGIAWVWMVNLAAFHGPAPPAAAKVREDFGMAMIAPGMAAWPRRKRRR